VVSDNSRKPNDVTFSSDRVYLGGDLANCISRRAGMVMVRYAEHRRWVVFAACYALSRVHFMYL